MNSAVLETYSETKYKIVATPSNSRLLYRAENGIIRQIDSIAAHIVVTSFEEGTEVFIDKKVADNIDVITEEYLQFNKPDKLKVAKNDLQLKYSRSIRNSLFSISLLDALEFLTINTKLASLGYFITEDNRDEKYLEIINSEDEELIKDLEIYLALLSKVNRILINYKDIKNILDDINKAESLNELNKIKDVNGFV